MDSQLPRPLRKRSIRSAIGTSRLASPAPAPTAMDCRCLEGWFFVARAESVGVEHDAGSLCGTAAVQVEVDDIVAAAVVAAAVVRSVVLRGAARTRAAGAAGNVSFDAEQDVLVVVFEGAGADGCFAT